MKNYLALHIDTDFLVGAVCADENNLSYPIKNENNDFLWLYFYNDPYSNIVSFGKENQKHCSEGKTNYYGNFIKLIENENNTFSIGEYEYPIIELLRYSKIIDILKNGFATKTLESQDNISTLLTFSLSISELSKQKLVDYLKKQGFNIVSYTIPLAELTCKFALENGSVRYADGNIVVFLEASNANLHLLKLVYTSGYFLLDGKPETKQGLGIDPRKRALLKYVVNKIGTMGVLSEQEKEAEYKIMEPKTDEWLNRLDMMQTNNVPVDINESLSKMPTAKRRILIYKDRIAEFTGSDIKLILDTYNDYVNRNILQDVSAIILLGNCFQNEIVISKFQNLIDNNRLFIYANKDIQNILSFYPKIDFKRYINEEERSKAKAEAEENKIAAQRAIDATKAAEAKAAKAKIDAEKKLEANRREAQKFYGRAVELDKEGKLQDALTNIENAVSLDENNTEYARFKESIRKKIRELYDKSEKYKSWLKDAESYEQTGELNKALKAYKNAQQIFDSAELRKKIVETEHQIEAMEKETKVSSFISIAIALADKGKFDEAIANINKALEIDPISKTANDALKNIYVLQSDKEKEQKYKAIVSKANTAFKEQNFDKAVEQYSEALSLKPADKYCLEQITKIKDLILQKQNKEKADIIVEDADKLFEKEQWENAKAKYEEALKLCPNDNKISGKIQQCAGKIKDLEEKYKDLLFDATLAEKDGKYKEAIDLLKEALKLKPTDKKIQSRIRTNEFNMEFGSSSNANRHNTPTIQTPVRQTDKDDEWNFKKPSKTTEFRTKKKQDDDFLHSGSKKAPEKEDFDDFLQPKKKNNDDFFIK